MQQYIVTGMTCASCQAHVEKAVSKLPDVKSVSVSLLTNSMAVDGTASDEEVIQAVEAAGYGAEVKGAEVKKQGASAKLQAEEDALKDRETPKLVRRLELSVGFLVLLMYFTMGHNMWGWPVPPFLNHNHLGLAIIQMLIAIIVMVINKAFFVSGFKSLAHGAPNMDTLVALGSSVSFGWSLYILFRMTWMVTQGASNMDLMPLYHNQLYFESAAMIPALITVGKTLESLSKGRTTDALKNLMKMAPKTAVVERNGQQIQVDIDDVQLGDIFVVKPGESIPVDGVIIEGNTAVDESALTGESIPVDKTVDDSVSAATINQSGFIRARATRIGEDTTFSQIIQMVSDAAATKAPIARIADKVSGVFVPAVILIAIAVGIIWLLIGASPAYAIEKAIAVLVVSCPCALGLATPVAIMVGNGVGAKNGILFKTSEALENAGRLQIVALDKTGTITEGKPRVTDVLPVEDVTRQKLFTAAYSLEQNSEHPLARAVVEKAEADGIHAEKVTDFQALAGHGLTAKLDGKVLYGGSNKFIAGHLEIPADMQKKADDLASQGKTPLFFEEDGRLIGIIAVADVIKKDSAQAVKELQNMGIEVVMLTGDNERTAQAIGNEAGVDRVIAGVLPDGKEAVIRNLQKRGKVAMVGDGINDAPALTRADTGIAIGAGTDVAIDSADVVLMNSKLTDVSGAVRLSRATLRNIHENLFWAFAYNVILIPIAAGLYARWGVNMNPMWGAAAMALSSFTVCMNALRINLFKVHNASHDHPMRHPAAPDHDSPKVMVAENGVNGRQTACPVPGDGNGNQDATVSGSGNSAATAKPENIGNAGIATDSGTAAEGAGNIEIVPEGNHGIVTVDGMMCNMCEKHVKMALEQVPGIKYAKADHETGKVDIVYEETPEEETMRQKIADADYTYVGFAPVEKTAANADSSEKTETNENDLKTENPADNNSMSTQVQTNGKKESKMKETVKIDGMMCGHCEATVKKALEGLDGVTSAEASHDKGEAVIETTGAVDEAAVKKAVEDAGYEFKGIVA